jgi:pimeloyl-ACP methyl ester carboxylesterase
MVTATARRAALLALFTLLALPNAAHALAWKDCPDFHGVRCSSVTVPLDRSGQDPGKIALRIARIGRDTSRTMLYLSGGPGGAGVSEMLGVMSEVSAIQRRYRVIGYDQRGTGRSGLLRCPALEKDPHLSDTAAAEACATSLGPARRHYTTADSVQDIEAIRQALRVDKLTLFGISYGTELALEYMRAYPQHVERVVIDSVLDPDDTDPFFTSSYHNMSPSLTALCPSHCAGISTDPAGDLRRLVAQLLQHPLKAVAYDGRGRPHAVTVSRNALLYLMFDADYDPALRAALPAAVKAALAGDGAPAARLIREGAVFDDLGPASEFSAARYATICEETPLPWDPGTPVDQRPAIAQQRLAALGPDAFAPFDPAASLEDEISLCLRWPDVPHPAPATPPPAYPAVPTLILQGGEDIRTPPEESARVAARIPGAKRVVVPGVGHAVTGDDPTGCGETVLLDFLAGRSGPATCKRVPWRVPGILYPPASFSALSAVKGLPAKVGRTVIALAATFDDIRLVLSPAVLENSGGGLRGGSWAARGQVLSLKRYEAVRGVTLTGGGKKRLRIRVGGSKAAHGTVTLRSGGRLKGTLGGHRINLRVGTSAAGSARVRMAALAR